MQNSTVVLLNGELKVEDSTFGAGLTVEMSFEGGIARQANPIYPHGSFEINQPLGLQMPVTSTALILTVFRANGTEQEPLGRTRIVLDEVTCDGQTPNVVKVLDNHGVEFIDFTITINTQLEGVLTPHLSQPEAIPKKSNDPFPTIVHPVNSPMANPIGLGAMAPTQQYTYAPAGPGLYVPTHPLVMPPPGMYPPDAIPVY